MPVRRRPSTKPRKLPRQERAHATVEAILQAATYILKKDGYAGMTTNAIATKAGVNIASVYQYFPNKESIFAELLRRHASEGRARALTVMQAGKGGSFETTVRRLIEGTLAEHRVAPELHRIFTTEAMRLGLPRIDTEADAALGDAWARWSRTTRRKNADLASWIARSAVHAVIHMALVERPADIDGLADELTTLVVRYLRP